MRTARAWATVQRYPLNWPALWKRTKPASRQRARFQRTADPRYNTDGSRIHQGMRALTLADALSRLRGEMDRLGAQGITVSTNVVLRNDGWPRSGQRDPEDPGAAVYFELDGKPRCLACDRWLTVADNVAAIAAHVAAIRAVDRYGVGTMEQAFAGYAQLQASHEEWWLVLGLERNAGEEDIEERFRQLARENHPDRGGSHAAMARINRARELAHAERRP